MAYLLRPDAYDRWLDPATQWRCLSEFSDNGFTRILGVEAPRKKDIAITGDIEHHHDAMDLDPLEPTHVAEAVGYRSLDRTYWT